MQGADVARIRLLLSLPTIEHRPLLFILVAGLLKVLPSLKVLPVLRVKLLKNGVADQWIFIFEFVVHGRLSVRFPKLVIIHVISYSVVPIRQLLVRVQRFLWKLL